MTMERVPFDPMTVQWLDADADDVSHDPDPGLLMRTCANCGAPLRVGMAGACEHCGVHVTGGEFDWVVSKIEQDDTYRG